MKIQKQNELISFLVENSSLKKYSVRIKGHDTSISLEPVFWQRIKEYSKENGISINELVSLLDENRQGNLSSTMRLFAIWLYK